TVTQNAPILHVAGLDENNQAFTINYRVTDGDGDTVDGSLAINVDDDTPTGLRSPQLAAQQSRRSEPRRSSAPSARSSSILKAPRSLRTHRTTPSSERSSTASTSRSRTRTVTR